MEPKSQLKQRLGRIPHIGEFAQYGSVDIIRIFDKSGSYHNFLTKYEEEYTVKLNDIESMFIEFVSTKYANGKRPHELEFIKLAINGSDSLIADFSVLMGNKYPKIKYTEHTITCIVNQLLQQFSVGTGSSTYAEAVFIKSNSAGDYVVSDVFGQVLLNKDFRKMLSDIIELGLHRNSTLYGNRYKDTCFQLYQKYTYEDVCRCLDWSNSEVALNIGGYKYHKTTKTYPVFINYDKDDHINDSIKYEDRFISPSSLIAISKSGRTIASDDVQQALKAHNDDVDLCLFVRKNKDDKISKEFYYLGRIEATGKVNEFTMQNTTRTAVEINYQLDTPLREDLYDYLAAGERTK